MGKTNALFGKRIDVGRIDPRVSLLVATYRPMGLIVRVDK